MRGKISKNSRSTMLDLFWRLDVCKFPASQLSIFTTYPVANYFLGPLVQAYTETQRQRHEIEFRRTKLPRRRKKWDIENFVGLIRQPAPEINQGPRCQARLEQASLPCLSFGDFTPSHHHFPIVLRKHDDQPTSTVERHISTAAQG